MYGFASYDIVQARQAQVAKRSTLAAFHGDAVRARRRARSLHLRSGLAFLPAPAARHVCCAA